MMMGDSAPFDRHDWIVNRCGKQVRYVIDFYPGHRMPGVPVAFHIDARPALDSVGAVVDRFIRMPLHNLKKRFFPTVSKDGASN
jgi:cytochrome c heme-lyase